MNPTVALRWAIEIVSLVAFAASAVYGGMEVEIKLHGPAKLRAGDTIDFEIVVTGTESPVHYAPHLTALDVAGKAAMSDRKVIAFTEKNRSKGKISCYEGLFALEATVTTETDDARTSVQIDVPRGGDCPPCPKPTPEPTPNPTPLPPAPPLPTPPTPLPNPDAVPAGNYGIAQKAAKITQAVYLAKTAGATPAQLTAIRTAWASEVDATAATAETIAAQIAAGTLKSILDVKITAPKSSGWDVASAALSAAVLETYKAHKGQLKLSLTGGIDAPAEWAEMIREIAAGIKGAK